MQVQVVAKNLATYIGRDSVIRVTAYFTLFVYGITQLLVERLDKRESTPFQFLLYLISIDSLRHVSNSCKIVSKHFATTRLIMRFFDDIPAIFNLYNYLQTTRKEPKETAVGRASKPKLDENNNPISADDKSKSTKPKKTVHSYVKFLTIVNLLFWVLYNPCEHLGWLAELKIIRADDQLWYFYTNVAWAGGLFTSVILNLRLVWLYHNQLEKKAKREDDPNYDSSEIISHTDMRNALLIALRDFIDWCIAIHFMPEGFLWSAQLYHYQVGLLGTISSLCRVHTYVINKQ